MSRECTEPRVERPRKCFNCQEEGHTSRDCPQPRVERPKKCFKCDQEGHLSRECTKSDSSKPVEGDSSNKENSWGATSAW